MDYKEAKPTMDSYVTPLVISTAGIIFSTLAIAVYHCILLRCVTNPQRSMQNNNNNNTNRSRIKDGGVQEEILNKIPIFSISSQTCDHIDVLDNECSICLGLFEDRDEVRLLPNCNHAFHRPCIDAWFIDHANCPFCRSPITCDCELALSSENVIVSDHQQQRVSHVPMNQLINYDDVSGSTSRFQRPRPVLLHSFSLSSHVRTKPRALIMGLKRSLSLDPASYIAITIQRDEGEGFTSSSSTKRVMMSEYYYRSRSLRHVELMSSGLMRSFSQFRNSGSGTYTGILPR